MQNRPRILVLFANEWDQDELARRTGPGAPEFVFFGDDLFHFPGFLRLPFFDPRKFIAGGVRKIASLQIDGVLSSDEYVGAACAAGVARAADLPGADPAAILTCQHKYYSRKIQLESDPATAVRCSLLPHRIRPGYTPELPYPFFTKPCKGTFSLFAHRIDSFADLERRLRFNPIERLLLGRLARPFQLLLREYTDFAAGADRFVAEELIQGRQVTVDGFAFGGQVTIMGTVDSVMYPGTEVFERFEYPSRLAPEIQRRLETAAERTAQALGIRHGQFNVELFYDEESGAIKIIEINPRLSYQFADLYENVDGTNSYDVMIDLALGRRPRFQRRAGRFRFSASFVLRAFAGRRLTRVPTESEVQAFNDRYPESRVRVYGREGRGFGAEMRASGNVRFGIVNVGADRLLDLFAIHDDARASLDFRYE